MLTAADRVRTDVGFLGIGESSFIASRLGFSRTLSCDLLDSSDSSAYISTTLFFGVSAWMMKPRPGRGLGDEGCFLSGLGSSQTSSIFGFLLSITAFVGATRVYDFLVSSSIFWLRRYLCTFDSLWIIFSYSFTFRFDYLTIIEGGVGSTWASLSDLRLAFGCCFFKLTSFTCLVGLAEGVTKPSVFFFTSGY